MPVAPFPRLVIAGLSGDAGKTVVSLSLLLAARRAGLAVRAFKKGPDYIDAAWLTWASGHPARNLDPWLMGFPAAVDSFVRNADPAGFNLIEGNRGLYDGVDPLGSQSTAELAKALKAPVVLVVDATKSSRTVAACVLGCQKLDPEVRIGCVILNRCGASRHERIIREAVESVCGIPVVGVLPKLPELLPRRHLGLVPPAERKVNEEAILNEVAAHLDFEALLKLAKGATGDLPVHPAPSQRRTEPATVTIGYLRDSAFTFYYPENLEALKSAGAALLPIDSLHASELPSGIDGLYIGGGFPETHAAALSANRAFLASLRRAAVDGLPIYAECGGLMLLSRAIRTDGRSHEMAGVLPFEVEQCASPQGHGYVELLVDRPNPFFPVGHTIRGHEFHYSRIAPGNSPPSFACSVLRGTGCGSRRDAVTLENVWASYAHVHALATPEWAAGFAAAAHQYAARPVLAL